ncbi:phosphoglycerate kinase, partial [Christensenella hongkongensis]
SDEEVYIDIGKETAAKYSETLNYAQTVFINGPMGVFEDRESELGTRAVWEAIAHSDAYSVVGGGDSVTATKKFGLKDEMSYICTGGGALVRFLSNEELPVIRALKHGSKL